MTTVFVYGTLVLEAVRRQVAPGARVVGPAIAPGWARVRDIATGLPNIVARPDGAVDGWLLEVDDDDLARLDHYEGVDVRLYDRRAIPVEPREGPRLEVQVYVMAERVMVL